MPAKRHVSSPIDLYVAGRVKLRRLELGMSQEELGAKVCVSLQQIQKYEAGKNRLGASRLDEIGRTLGVSPAYFFEGLPENKKKPGSPEVPTDLMNQFLSDRSGMDLMRAFCRISDRKLRRQIMQLIHTLSTRGG